MERSIVAPMPGLVARVVVTVGEKVEQGQEVAVINCMKTEIPVTADCPGTVRGILVKEWDEMQVGDAMVAIDAA